MTSRRSSTYPIRWGILSTAHIAKSAFLPALQAAGGVATVVASRDADRARVFAEQNAIAEGVGEYETILERPDVEAVYIPLPNGLHSKWTIKALEAGKAVLTEKPLTGSLPEAERVLQAARSSKRHLWEAFVFPFQRQHQRVLDLVESGIIGELREIHSEFHFRLTHRDNIRLSPELNGGALNDVGCYPIRFAQLVFDSPPVSALAVATSAPEGVDEEMQGVLEFGKDRRLVFSCGMTRNGGAFTRVIGTIGEIRLTNPFHPRDWDTLELHSGGAIQSERLGTSEPTFTPALRHIEAVLRDLERPTHTALDDTLATEQALHWLRTSSTTGRLERSTPV